MTRSMTVLLLSLLANDSAVIGVGGTVESFDTSTKVEMTSEHIQVDFAQRRVEADFVFRNTGDATSVMMGFPEEGAGDVQPPTPAEPSYFKSFESWVDGVPAKTELWKGDSDEMFYKQWWTKTVDFPPGAIRRIRNVYVTQFSSDVMTLERMTYVLGTGKAWHGKIGSAKVVFDIGGVPSGDLVSANPKFTRRSGHKLVWEFSEFEPPEATFSISVGRFARDSVFQPKPGENIPGLGVILRR
ncbi:MAG: DUF4424 family protein [Fimbriimonadaceae bacterium]